MLKPSSKSTHFRSQILRRINKQFVSRMFNQYFIAGFEQRRHSQKISVRRTIGGDDTLNWHLRFTSQRLLKRFISVADGPINFQVFNANMQIAQSKPSESTVRQIVSSVGTLLGPSHVFGTHHTL